ncbi:hypothetical protein BDD12DRAFT_806228 [Trichophaea hybrida]|nr:hypothetical protein BDD12DRAFT_806228 [Trichophaea hybrida]
MTHTPTAGSSNDWKVAIMVMIVMMDGNGEWLQSPGPEGDDNNGGDDDGDSTNQPASPGTGGSHTNYPMLLLPATKSMLGRRHWGVKDPYRDPYPTDVHKLSAESFERACPYLKEAPQGDISTAAIHTSAAWGIFAEQAREIAADQYINNFRNMSNDDRQKPVASLISRCTYRFHHSDFKNELPGTYTDLYTQWESIPELNQKQILQIHMQRIDRANSINRKGLAVTWWDPNTVIVDENIDE